LLPVLSNKFTLIVGFPPMGQAKMRIQSSHLVH
jgi:hypothetical protein